MLLILYRPKANHTRLRAKKINLGVIKKFDSAFGSAKCANVLSRDKILVKGEMIADDVVLIEKIFNWLPLIHIMKAFMRICCLVRKIQSNKVLEHSYEEKTQ